MRFLIDNSLSPRFAAGLRAAGHDAVHVRDRGRADIEDAIIFDMAQREDRLIVAMDTDFGTLLAQRGAAKPSVVLFRQRQRQSEHLLATLAKNLGSVETDLHAGAIVIFDDARIRIRRLPIH